MIIHTYFCTKNYDYVKCFFLRIRFVSDKYRVSQNIAKNGEHCIVDFQLKPDAKTPYTVADPGFCMGGWPDGLKKFQGAQKIF